MDDTRAIGALHKQATTAAARLRLDALPSQLLRFVGEQFCADADAACLARCTRRLLQSMHDYRLKAVLKPDVAIRLTRAAEERRRLEAIGSTNLNPAFGLPLHVQAEVESQTVAEDDDLTALQSLASCASTRRLRLEVEAGSTHLASSLPLPPNLLVLLVEGAWGNPSPPLRVRQSVEELRLPSSITTLRMPLLSSIGSDPKADPRASSLCPLPILPPGLQRLCIDWYSHWGEQALPSSLQSLKLQSIEYTQTLLSSSSPAAASQSQSQSTVWPLLPEGLQSLFLGFGVRNHASLSSLRLPSSLTLLDLSLAFELDQPLESLSLPPQLRSLHLSRKFNQPVEDVRLPPSLTELKFQWNGGRFNQPIERLQLPAGLRTLLLSWSFNQPCANLQLPDSLTELRFGASFKNSLPQLPDSIRSLNLGGKWRQGDSSAAHSSSPETLRLPASLASFTLPLHFPTPLRDHLHFAPHSRLTHLALPSALPSAAVARVQWPSSLRSLRRVSASDCAPWPPLLDTLRLDFIDDGELHQWQPPSTLTHLHLMHMPGECARIRWPTRMQRLTVDLIDWERVRGPFNWPPSLTSIRLMGRPNPRGGVKYDLPEGFLPDSLRELAMPSVWEGPLDSPLTLPAGLRSLEIGSEADGSQFGGSLVALLRALPTGLQSLAMHRAESASPLLAATPSTAPTHAPAAASAASISSPVTSPFGAAATESAAAAATDLLAAADSGDVQLPPSLTHLRIYSRKHLSTEGWTTLLDQRPNCSVSFGVDFMQHDNKAFEMRRLQSEAWMH